MLKIPKNCMGYFKRVIIRTAPKERDRQKARRLSIHFNTLVHITSKKKHPHSHLFCAEVALPGAARQSHFGTKHNFSSTSILGKIPTPITNFAYSATYNNDLDCTT